MPPISFIIQVQPPDKLEPALFGSLLEAIKERINGLLTDPAWSDCQGLRVRYGGSVSQLSHNTHAASCRYRQLDLSTPNEWNDGWFVHENLQPETPPTTEEGSQSCPQVSEVSAPQGSIASMRSTSASSGQSPRTPVADGDICALKHQEARPTTCLHQDSVSWHDHVRCSPASDLDDNSTVNVKSIADWLLNIPHHFNDNDTRNEDLIKTLSTSDMSFHLPGAVSHAPKAETTRAKRFHVA